MNYDIRPDNPVTSFDSLSDTTKFSIQKINDSTFTYQVGGKNLPYSLAAEIPVLIDYRIMDVLSLHGGVGYKFGIVNDFSTGIRGDLVGTLGFTFWLNYKITTSLGTDKRKWKTTNYQGQIDENRFLDLSSNVFVLGMRYSNWRRYFQY